MEINTKLTNFAKNDIKRCRKQPRQRGGTMPHISEDQIARLRELDSKFEHGLGDNFEAWLDSMDQLQALDIDDPSQTSEAPSDIREKQAQVLWDKGFGREQGYAEFKGYLATIPPQPERPTDLPDYLDKLILVDARIARTQDKDGEYQFGGLVKVCELLRVKFTGNNSIFEPFNPEQVKKQDVYWMWCQDGKRNLGKTVQTCRKEFAENEIGLDAMEGLALFAQHRKIPEDHYMDLPSSVHCGNRKCCANLDLWDDVPELDLDWDGDADSRFGSASRGE